MWWYRAILAGMSAFDAHTHLDAAVFLADLDGIVDRAHAAGVTGWAVAGSDPAGWSRVLDVADRTGGIATLGLHPWWVDRGTPDEVDAALQRLPDLLTPHGLGEIGLDHHTARDDQARARQLAAFRHQLALARERDLPVVLHCVRAWSELVGWLRRDGLPRAGGLLHGFTGSAQTATELQGLGLHLGVGRAALGRGAPRLLETLRQAVLAENLVLETDGPWPDGRGEPADLVEVAMNVASAYNCRVLDLLERAGATARSLWRQC